MVTGQSSEAGPAGPHEAPRPPPDRWGPWTIRWLGAMLVASLLGVALWLVLEGGGSRDGWDVVWMVVFSVPIAFVVAVLTLVATATRWALSRFAPPHLQDALVPVVALGAVAAAVPMWLFWFGGQLTGAASPAMAAVLGLLVPAGLGGGVASYLAERQVSLRRSRWWMATVGTALAGALLTAVAFSPG